VAGIWAMLAQGTRGVTVGETTVRLEYTGDWHFDSSGPWVFDYSVTTMHYLGCFRLSIVKPFHWDGRTP
jgi:hypothetical protein